MFTQILMNKGLLYLTWSLCFTISLSCSKSSQVNEPLMQFTWDTLPDLPQAVGGPLTGVSNGALLVAGGSYFSSSMFEGGTRIWQDAIFVLEAGDKVWRSGFKLPKSLGYSATVDTDQGVVCIGGHGAKGVSAEVIRLRWNSLQKSVEIDTLPSLPHPITFAGATIAGNTIYLAGGQRTLEDKAALSNFWAFDLSKPPGEQRWEELDSWPGPARVLPGMAAQNSGEKQAIFLFSGAEIVDVPEGKVPRRCLTDGYRYDPREQDQAKRWKRIAELDRPVVAAPVISSGPSHIIIFSGTDCVLDDQFWILKDNNPGIPPDIRIYHTITDTWIHGGDMPNGKGVVTSKAVHWQGGMVLTSGEDRPAHRTPKVWITRVDSKVPAFGILNFSVMGLYFLLLVFIGIYLSGRENTTNDYFLGGRRVPWWAAGLSIFGTQLSALTFMALPAKVYATDWTYYLGQAGIVLMTPVVIYFFMPLFRRLNITTAYEYLEMRFNLAIRLLASLNFILLQVGRMAIVLYLPSVALSTVTGIDMYLSILVMGILSTLYTVMGGIEAVIWTDVVQVIVILGGSLVSLVLMVNQLDGSAFQLAQSAWDQGKFNMLTWQGDYTTTAVWVVVLGTMVGTLVTYTSDQTVIQRYLTTSNQKQAARALWTNAIITPISGLIFFGLGTGLFLFYQGHPQSLNPELQTDAILPFFVVQQLPSGISGLVIAALFAAAMSSLDSSMNSISATVVTDFFKRFKPGMSESRQLTIAQWSTILAGTIGTLSALLLAKFQVQSIWDMIFILTGLLGGGLGGIFILGIFSQKAHSMGVLVGLLSSAGVMLYVQQSTSIHFFLFTLIGVTVCVVVGYLASLVLQPAKFPDLAGLTIYNPGSHDTA